MAQGPSTPASKSAVPGNQPERDSAGDVSKAAKTLTEKLESARIAAADAQAARSQEKQARDDARRAAPTQPARRQLAANDDLPSIGGLIYALQQRPSRSPFMFAAAASVIWLLLGGGAGWAMVTSNASSISGFGDFIQHPVALAVAATVIIPIALFWFLALLIWRAQELRLMASAMTEVAVRLAEPDKMAEQSVASLGQTIRRQVAAMNDAISRALGRAGELEALVHNEVAALENSYSDNELRIRRLIDELSSEREALTNNSERVSETLRGVGSQIAKDINVASEQATRSLGTATANIAESLTAKSGKITAAMTAAGAAIDNKLVERGTKLTEALQHSSQKAADAVDVKANALFHSLNSVGEKLSKDVPGLLERLDGEQKRLNTIIAAANQNFAALETAVAQRTTQLDTTLKDRTEQFRMSVVEHATQIDSTLKQRSERITANLAAQATQLDSSLKQRTDELGTTLATNTKQIDSSIRQRTDELATTLTASTNQIDTSIRQRTEELASTLATSTNQIDSSLKQRTGELHATLTDQATQIDAAFQSRTEELKASLADRIRALDGTVRKQTESIEQSLTKNTMALNQTFAEGADAVKRNTLALEHALAEGAETVKQNSLQMTQNTSHATENMKSQADVLKQVSNGMLQQIHGLTQRFETQGQAIMTAANALDSSNAKIDSILERRHTEISALLDMVSNKAQDLDKMMHSYTGIIDSSLINVEARAKELSTSLVQESTAQSRATIEEIERLRADARVHTSKAVEELQQSFGSITQQVANQLGSLTQQFGKTTREMRSTASQTVGEIETTRQELQRRMRDLPQESRQSADAMRKAVSDQLQALSSLSAIAKEQQHPAPASPQHPPALPPQGYNPETRGSNGIHTGSQLPLSGAALQPHNTPPRQQPPQPPAPYSNGSGAHQQEDLRSVTSTLAQRLAGSAPAHNTAPERPQSGVGVQITGNPPQANQSERWSVGDLLARASEPDSRNGFAAPPPRQEPPRAAPTHAAGDLRLTDLARAIDHGTAANIWQRFQRGERGIFSRQLYTSEGQAAFDEITTRFQHDPEFRSTVDRYIGDFERLLGEAEGKGQDPAIVQNYLTSETGRVYLMLAHASGRLQ